MAAQIDAWRAHVVLHIVAVHVKFIVFHHVSSRGGCCGILDIASAEPCGRKQGTSACAVYERAHTYSVATGVQATRPSCSDGRSARQNMRHPLQESKGLREERWCAELAGTAQHEQMRRQSRARRMRSARAMLCE